MIMYFKALRINFKYGGTAEHIGGFSTLYVVVILLFSSTGFAQHRMYDLKQETIQCLGAGYVQDIRSLSIFVAIFIFFFYHFLVSLE